MKKLFLSTVLITVTTILSAQQWNPSGDNTTTGRVTANDVLLKNLHLAYGNDNANWSNQDHIKDRSFIYTLEQSKGMFFSAYGQGADIRFQTGNNWASRPNASLILLNDGRVGIGTLIPDMKLTVNGKIHAQGVKIDLDIPVPDYVFKEDYNLKSIEEVELFIKKNGHLPEIPSAKEFEQNGVMLAEMDMNLLKKIEELTLYTIQQENKIKNLEEENEEVKLLNKKLLELQLRLEKLENKN